MPFDPALLAYAGLACLALTSQRVRREAGLASFPNRLGIRVAAAILLSLSVWRAVYHFGLEQGSVAFVGMICLAGLPLVLLLSRFPRAGLSAGVGAAIVALISIHPGLAG